MMTSAFFVVCLLIPSCPVYSEFVSQAAAQPRFVVLGIYNEPFFCSLKSSVARERTPDEGMPVLACSASIFPLSCFPSLIVYLGSLLLGLPKRGKNAHSYSLVSFRTRDLVFLIPRYHRNMSGSPTQGILSTSSIPGDLKTPEAAVFSSIWGTPWTRV